MARLSRRVMLALGGAGLIGAAWAGMRFWRGRGPDPEAVRALYARPNPAPNGALAVYHLGHSLVGQDMPAMLQQLAPDGHMHHSQLGWGASNRDHWEPDVPVNGFAEMNSHPAHRPARAALEGGAYDALVLTEMVEIRDAIKWHDAARYLHKWIDLARSARPDLRVFLYETWHRLDDAEGWLARVDADLARHWEAEILFPALKAGGLTDPVYVIPAGQVLAAVVRAIEGQSGLGTLRDRHDLFATAPDGTPDQIHLSDIGAYLVALTHYAVLYQRSPVGLAHQLDRADGTAADAPDAKAARQMQQIVWDVVRRTPRTGVTA